jgi:hypothetical protein
MGLNPGYLHKSFLLKKFMDWGSLDQCIMAENRPSMKSFLKKILYNKIERTKGARSLSRRITLKATLEHHSAQWGIQ